MGESIEVLTDVVAESLTADGGSLTTLGDYADSMTSTERGLAGVLADVMHVDRVPLDSHFFDDPGADSLVMAHFCARVRKRAYLPSVSMYRNQTLRSLAKALTPEVSAQVDASLPTAEVPVVYPAHGRTGDNCLLATKVAIAVDGEIRTNTGILGSNKLNAGSRLQSHSQEDGAFKSDHITIGAGCTLGVGSLVHYGVSMGEGAVLAPDSFLMKGEDVPPYARWGGNPAREIDDNRATVQVGGK